ncbi:Enoyl-CoA hydratase isomerase [Teratosphaeria destructans]|uniref:Enoyl-CoA hydratase isomerase n=1 Tax=Teratosphaeria destructans TaxID=418781 RepID=A0A9W7T133_9PEZI|nr:Enoyl-CoA hydratase isomerase [Teratosphaeria destructans]
MFSAAAAAAATRQAGRHHGLARQWLNGVAAMRRGVSSLSSSIHISSVPAPHSGSIAVISLNRPRARNAISTQLLSELGGVVEGLHREGGGGGTGSTRALILASECDDAFCAGADLKERVNMSQADVEAFLRDLRATFTRLATLPTPPPSPPLSGTAFGGGLEIALCTHFRVALPETRLAIIPGGGEAPIVCPPSSAPTRARDMILTGRRVSGPEAYFLGLADRLVEVNEEQQKAPGVARGLVMEQAIDLARVICEGGPVAIKAAQQAMDGWGQGEERENAAYDMVLRTEDRTEALKAFGEKRKPVFKGR